MWIGAAISSLLITTGKVLIGLYLGRSAVTSAYGAVSSPLVVLVWIYYSAQILLFGAEFTHIYATRHGSRVETPFRTVAPDRGESGLPLITSTGASIEPPSPGRREVRVLSTEAD